MRFSLLQAQISFCDGDTALRKQALVTPQDSIWVKDSFLTDDGNHQACMVAIGDVIIGNSESRTLFGFRFRRHGLIGEETYRFGLKHIITNVLSQKVYPPDYISGAVGKYDERSRVRYAI